MGVLRVKVAGQWIDVGTSIPPPNRNLLDNGQMAVKQRAATSVTPFTTATFLADRWQITNSGVGAANLAFAAMPGAASLPVGRPRPGNQQYITIATAEAAGALAAGDYMSWQQVIEGQFIQHLGWGTSDPQPVTLSFDVYSSVAATYVVELYRSESTPRHFPKAFSVPAGWSTQSITWPGDTATVTTNDNAGRLVCAFWLGAGSTYASGTQPGGWATSVNANRAAGIGNQLATAISNQFSLNNVQLEIGTQATPYEVRRLDDELRRCQRYYEQRNNTVGTVVGTGQVFSATAASIFIQFMVEKRAAITAFTSSAPGVFQIWNSVGSAALVLTSIAANSGTPQIERLDIGFASGGVGGDVASMYTNAASFLGFSAEI